MKKRASNKSHKARAGRRSGIKSFKKGTAAKKVNIAPERRQVIAGARPWRYLEADGRVAIERVAAELRMSRAKLAETAGIAAATLQRSARADAPKTQARLRETLEIVNRVSAWAGGPMQAMAWYRAEPIPAFGGRTAESLVKDGKAAAVRDYLDGVALGGFA